ncbi:11179_t:CDS:2 [Acaulospora morrowiae]|uniref:11179_t:CDS:1 n=1 Tax=Acaulospora morrowiae TaxID=94023 RepID=A0A9N9FQ41_9GLOM|nr:11179_t:CDS:2 [Acaulospora morrowiae]
MPPQTISEHVPIEGPKTFSREEVLKSRDVVRKSMDGTKYETCQPWYIIIDNKVYDVKDFVPDHPGGSVILTLIGKDATDAFNNFHQESTHDLLANYYVGDVAPEDIASTKEGFSKELRELKELFVKLKYFESSKAYYLFKISSNISIWASSVLLLYAFGNSILGVLVAAIALAIFWQQCGWLAHDFLHHQVFQNRDYNNLAGCFIGSVCQGFDPSWWKDKHNTHHAAPNVHGQDPDINTHPILSWSEYALTDLFDPELASENAKILPQWLAHLWVNNQTILYLPIMCFARISWCIQSIIFILPNGQLRKPANAHMPITKIQQISLLLHYVWLSWMLSLIDNWFLRLFFLFSAQTICGLLLATVFSLNHFGMKILSEDESSKMDFFVEQIITGRDIIALNPANQWIVDWFTGGLNYQIEHHIFPAIPRHHFHKIQPIIQGLCAKHQVPYHMTTFFKGTTEVFGTLGDVSLTASKKY